jgi:hypothetical protein
MVNENASFARNGESKVGDDNDSETLVLGYFRRRFGTRGRTKEGTNFQTRQARSCLSYGFLKKEVELRFADL